MSHLYVSFLEHCILHQNLIRHHEGKHCEEICAFKKAAYNSRRCVLVQVTPNADHSEKRPVPNCGTAMAWIFIYYIKSLTKCPFQFHQIFWYICHTTNTNMYICFYKSYADMVQYCGLIIMTCNLHIRSMDIHELANTRDEQRALEIRLVNLFMYKKANTCTK